MALTDSFAVTETVINNKRLNWWVAEGDFNGDGYLDFVFTDLSEPRTLQPLTLAMSTGTGGYQFQANAVAAGVSVEEAHGLAGDFNNDGKLDIALFDAGHYDWTARLTMGRPPALLLGDGRGGFTASTALANAVTSAPKSYLGSFSDADLGVKDVASGDIDNDGDLDFWVESAGSDNITNHFMINNGDGTFSVDAGRIAKETIFGSASGDYFRYGAGDLADVNGDGWLDLILLQIRDNHPSHLNQSSYVVYNDKTGHFPLANRVALPLPDFYFGYTSAGAAAFGDLNGDGRTDIVVAHTRNDDVTGPNVETPWQGRYLQVLIATADGKFVDETAARMGDQSKWTHPPDNQHNAPREMAFFDIDRDNDLDLIMADYSPRPLTSAPAVMINNGKGVFTPMDPNYLTGGDPWYGEMFRLADINGDGLLDMAHLDPRPGVDGVYGTADDGVALVVQYAKAPAATASVAGATAATTAWLSILRQEALDSSVSKAALDAQIARLASGASLSAVVADIVKVADATTSVATLAYQFFTGKIPGLGGIDYLVSPTGPNPNNLNSSYYQSFNLENRYINFAVNLGNVGEGKANFATKYGALSLFDATREAYKTIFGITPTDAKIHALIDTRADYFASYGGDGVNGQGTKAAMVGWLLAEAVKADVGMYARANDAFLTDLSDGAAFAIDLIGVYGKPEYANF